MKFQENTGTATSPTFGALQSGPFSFPTNSYVFPIDFNLADIDNDGDLDLFATNSYYGTTLFYENVGSASAPLFDTLASNPFGISSYIGKISDIADLDGDGDYDIITLNSMTYHYFENTGTPTSPAFGTSTTTPFGINPAPTVWSLIDFVDFDGDGDLDLFQQDYNSGDKIYQENTGTSTSPSFGTPQTNPFGLVATTEGLAPEMVDIDADGDIDMFVTSYYNYGTTYFFENNGGTTFIPKNQEEIEITLFPNPAQNQITFSGKVTGLSFQVLSSEGKLIESGKLTKNQLDIQSLNKGTYLIKLFNNSINQTLTFNKL